MLFKDFTQHSSGLYLRHTEENEWLGKSGMTEEQLLKEFGSQPVCPKCERPAWRDKGWKKEKRAQCNHCGWAGIASVTVKEYMENKMYKG
ncbi:hypothetical protein [Anaerosolibacter sp.]|uniref:hypothetical protein n=1 Tax=Anaerosolibacter sp. TaxID=1872527 RepID=UPI0039F078E8